MKVGIYGQFYHENSGHYVQQLLDLLDQKGVEVIFSQIKNSNHFFKDREKELTSEIEKYLKEKTALI